jgi:large subunit ribosomal protein L6
MSRIGKLPVIITAGVTVKIDGQQVEIKGPKGQLTISLHEHVKVEQVEQHLTVTVQQPDNQADRALWGLSRVLLSNMVTGVTEGYTKKLEINGVGFKAAVSGQNLVLNLGFSHPVNFPIPTGATIAVEKNVVTISGIDKQLIGETAAKIRSLKKPEPYKGKGIKYQDEIIRRKAGKVVKATGSK